MSFRNVPFILLSCRFYLQQPRTRLALRCIGEGTDMAHSHICNAIKDLGQYRTILSADTASEVRQMLSQKRR